MLTYYCLSLVAFNIKYLIIKYCTENTLQWFASKFNPPGRKEQSYLFLMCM